MKRYRRTALSQYLIIGFILIAIIGTGFLSQLMMSRIPYPDYFAIPWAAGRSWLLEGINPYDESIIDVVSKGISDSPYLGILPEPQIFQQPILNLIFYLPFSLIPFEFSRVIWMTVLLISIVLIGHVSIALSGWRVSTIERILILFFIIAWFPTFQTLLTGKLSPIVVLMIFLGINAIIKDQDITAGFFLALSVGSLPLSMFILILITIWSISRKRWSIIIAFFSGLFFILILTILMLPSWPMDWLRIVLNLYEDLAWIQTPLQQLASILPGISNFLSISLHATMMIYLILLYITSVRKTGLKFVWKIMAVLVTTILLQIVIDISHLFLVVPALFFVFRFWSERWRLFGKLVSWTIVMLITGVSWVIFIPGLDFRGELNASILSLGLPLLIFLGMIWSRWWALKIPQLPPEFR